MTWGARPACPNGDRAMGLVEWRFDPAFVEEAVLLDVSRRASSGDAQTVHLVHLSEVNNLAPLARDTVRAALDAEGLHAVQVEAIRPNAGGPWWTACLRTPSVAAAG